MRWNLRRFGTAALGLVLAAGAAVAAGPPASAESNGECG